ncbi:hypothetical protein BET10_18520 [Pseudoalteromonas amylolytica]|uniref:Uncharacterized protein n=1 Tax=Pseudoalteromonas amylolytica TaxID=1859457 RepID=A0A1S1MRF7_9GAMM|nr:hypothetical protein BFC16_14235 [Pseudoalteromonas sp. JW3]OHU88815.1 hypothetical protein BET10_18520 [Pseudoalteromonas amylolytica]
MFWTQIFERSPQMSWERVNLTKVRLICLFSLLFTFLLLHIAIYAYLIEPTEYIRSSGQSGYSIRYIALIDYYCVQLPNLAPYIHASFRTNPYSIALYTVWILFSFLFFIYGVVFFILSRFCKENDKGE